MTTCSPPPPLSAAELAARVKERMQAAPVSHERKMWAAAAKMLACEEAAKPLTGEQPGGAGRADAHTAVMP